MTLQKSLPYACRNRRARWWARQATKLRGFGVPARGNAFIPCRAIQAELGGFRWQMTFGKWPAGFFNCKVLYVSEYGLMERFEKTFFFPSISMTHVLHSQSLLLSLCPALLAQAICFREPLSVVVSCSSR